MKTATKVKFDGKGQNYDILDMLDGGDLGGVRVSVQRGMVVIKRFGNVPRETKARTNIVKFSAGSGIRMRRYLRNSVAEYSVMGTLTYPYGYPADGKIVKEHLRRFIQEIRRDLERSWSDCVRMRDQRTPKSQFSLFWFMEFQRRGAPHFHFFANAFIDAKWMAQKWYEIVGSDDKRHLAAGTRIETIRSGRAGTMAYAGKYAAKMEQKIVPPDYMNVGRFWGVSGMRGTVEAATEVTYAAMKEPGVQSSLNRMKATLRDAVATGMAVNIVDNDDVMVISFESDWLQSRMITLLHILVCKSMDISGVKLRPIMPELMFNLED